LTALFRLQSAESSNDFVQGQDQLLGEITARTIAWPAINCRF